MRSALDNMADSLTPEEEAWIIGNQSDAFIAGT